MTTIIPLSRTKLFATIAGSIVFAALGIYFILDPETFGWDRYSYGEDLVPFVGAAAVLVFGGIAIYGVMKLYDKTPGLVIDEEGIIDNSSAVAVGRVLWKDVESINTMAIRGTHFLNVMVRNPKQYTNGTRGLRKLAAQSAIRMYGTPVSISAVSLQCKFRELERLVKQGLEESRQSQSQ